MNLYQIASATKFVLGLIILILVYSYINVYEDPGVGISLGFLGLFIMLWGLSFYIFLLGQKIFRTNQDQERITKDSYKLSLLFGIYAIINVLLLILGNRSKILGLILLIGFIALQISLFSEKKQSHEHRI
ncbi:MAG: hypothetical protein WAZ12_03945 [Candidatus Absconditicoccaceae bacterium]